MIYPELLKKGDTIGTTATSYGLVSEVDLQKLENAKNNLAGIGYNLIETENVRKLLKIVSSTGEERAKEFYELYSNPEVKHIIIASGGEFLMEMLPWLDKYDLSTLKPKWVQGFSDTSLLLLYLTTKYNIASVHSCNLGGYGKKELDKVYVNTLNMISDDSDMIQESFEMYESSPINWEEGKEFELPRLDTKVEYKNLYTDDNVKMQGRLLCGCMDSLRSIIGTNYDNVNRFCSQYEEGIVWCLENCEMTVCDMYRTLWQMKEAGWFNNAKGFLIGRTSSSNAVDEYTYEDALHDALDSLNVPVIYDVDVGHTNYQWTMINGSSVEFEYENGKGKIKTMFK